ncbi:TIGR03915 family putative DNA repair protein [Treponema sp. R80B11-R83G3]
MSLAKVFSNISGAPYVFSEEKLLELTANEQTQRLNKADIDFVTFYFSNEFNVSQLEETARNLFELSANAFNGIIMAWISELPIEKEIISFGKGILSAAQNFNGTDDKRRAAERAANNRANADVLTVLTTANRVQIEVHRMMGLLRFSVNEDGQYVAKCDTDHFVLPCLGEFFTARFGDTPWAIIDEKRSLRLGRKPGDKAKIDILEESIEGIPCAENDEWEELWKHYHKTINNEDRKNTDLQRQFMPKRYWKHLPEM